MTAEHKRRRRAVALPRDEARRVADLVYAVLTAPAGPGADPVPLRVTLHVRPGCDAGTIEKHRKAWATESITCTLRVDGAPVAVVLWSGDARRKDGG